MLWRVPHIQPGSTHRNYRFRPSLRRRSPQPHIKQGTRPPLTQQLQGAMQVPPSCPGGQGQPRAQRRAPGPQQPQQPLAAAAQPQGRRHLAPHPPTAPGLPADCLSKNNPARPQRHRAPVPRLLLPRHLPWDWPPRSPQAQASATARTPTPSPAVRPRGAPASPLVAAGSRVPSPSRPLGPTARKCPALRRRPRGPPKKAPSKDPALAALWRPPAGTRRR